MNMLQCWNGSMVKIVMDGVGRSKGTLVSRFYTCVIKVPSLVLSSEDCDGEQRSSVPETLHRLAIGEQIFLLLVSRFSCCW